MPLLWANPGTGNRFANKHLLVIGGAPTLQEMVDDGLAVFEARRKAFQLNKDRRRKNIQRAKDLKDKYGAA